MPRVSVIMPLYNKELYVERAVLSALSQSYEDFELIVVNDGSTDKGPEKIMSIKDERIKIIEQPNSGVSAARSRGIREARADLIAFLDADDEWEPDYLETIMKLVSKFPGASVFATNYYFYGRKKRIAVIRALPNNFTEGLLDNYFIVASQSDPPLWSSAVAVRKEAIESVGGFPAGISSGEDLLTWARLAIRYKIAYSSLPKAIFYAPDRMVERPLRHPQVPDRVAAGFLDMLSDSALPDGAKKGLTAYMGLWHRMRAVVFIKLNNGPDARREISSAIHYSGLTRRLILLLLLSLLPARLMADMFHALHRFRYALRKGTS